MSAIIRGKRLAQFATDILGQALRRRVIDGQLYHVAARKVVAPLLKANLPVVGRRNQGEVRIVQRQQEAVIEPLANLPGQSLQDGKVKDQLIGAQFAFDLDQHTVVMTMQPLALSSV